MKEFKNLNKFIKILEEYERDNPEELFPPAIDAQFAFDCISEAFLGPNYYISLPCSNNQGNTIELDEILRTHSRDYRKLVKKRRKELKHHET